MAVRTRAQAGSRMPGGLRWPLSEEQAVQIRILKEGFLGYEKLYDSASLRLQRTHWGFDQRKGSGSLGLLCREERQQEASEPQW